MSALPFLPFAALGRLRGCGDGEAEGHDGEDAEDALHEILDEVCSVDLRGVPRCDPFHRFNSRTSLERDKIFTRGNLRATLKTDNPSD